METQIEFFEYITGKYYDNHSSDVVMGAHVFFYYFTYSKNKSSYDGELIYKTNGEVIDVSFLNMGEAVEEQMVERIYHSSLSVSDEGVLRPWMFKHFKQSTGESGWWGLCYDRFDISLFDWAKKLSSNELSDPNKVNLKIGFRRLCDYWCSTIRQLIDVISHIHAQGIFHGSLGTTMSYVFVGDTLKIINIEGGHIEDLIEANIVAFQIRDFKQFRLMLQLLFQSILGPLTTWPEVTRFLGCFNTKLE
ncbi:uncharacterized protein Pyn_22312 [Prunus yedoensis var. nudiflora]|uniref:Protein kinase domain-containing protein n=1 Tax=Prunus yedoensis var. nudiflora TaxID=2094558 RepID=A0A314ZQ69_PRUYE|nr:uncharacterized protein Pyn_22312 [Prunus yedoensis var. nudiflora]